MRLVPSDTRFFPMFVQAATTIAEAATELDSLVRADPADRPMIAQQVRDLEHAGDETTHLIMRQIDHTFVTPFDREDIYRLASGLDDCLDFIEQAADLTVLYAVGALPSEAQAMTGVLLRAAEATQQAMQGLQTPVRLSDYWVEANALENEADRIYRALLARLFADFVDPLTVLKLKDVATSLEAAADAFERVANIVESIAVKES